MKIRLEGTEKEIKDFLVGHIKLVDFGDVYKNISKFYPNRVNSTDLMNGLVDEKNPVGRVYVEIG
jgi:hypothetical protein